MNAIRIPLLLSVMLAFGCQPRGESVEKSTPASDVEELETPRVLVAVLNSASGSNVTGTVTFSEGPDSTVVVQAVVAGLESGSSHGIHVHEFGDCSAPDASSAGGHFNPMGAPHGAPTDAGDRRHVGDLGNLVEVAEGVAEFEMNDPLLRLHGATSIEGKAVVVHAGADDFTSQPSGAAGARVACGVIAVESPTTKAPVDR